MTEQAAVPAASTTTKRSRRRNDHDLWSLRDALNMVINELQKMNERLDRMGTQSETQRKLSEAGKKSAEARRKKFGSARPGDQVQKDLLGEPVREPVQEGVPTSALAKKVLTKEERTPGGMVWLAYSMAYRNRHKVDPIRNAKVNAQCKALAAQVGVDEARNLVCYYVERNDAFYLNAKHPLGLLLLDLQKLRTEYATGQSMTMRDARRQEVHASTDQSIREYAATQGALE